MTSNTTHQRQRLRDLGITIGHLLPGQHNAITDVPGVKVGHCTLIYDEPRIARTGVTVILPRGETLMKSRAYAGYHVLNGNGEMTGLSWIEESGMLTSPIAITNTHQVGVVRDTMIQIESELNPELMWRLPVVAETYDGFLNDIDAFHIQPQHVRQAFMDVHEGVVPEGNVGGGTGMICHGFKGGIGTASRRVDFAGKTYTVGVLVQANHGRRSLLRVGGVPIGLEIPPEVVPLPSRPATQPVDDSVGSIIIIVATDGPLIPMQCQRLAQRATIGLGRVGGLGENSSGDIFLAFSTGNDLPAKHPTTYQVQMIPNDYLSPFFEAVVEATEESIINSLCAAETMHGFQGTAYALPLDELQRIMTKYRPVGV